MLSVPASSAWDNFKHPFQGRTVPPSHVTLSGPWSTVPTMADSPDGEKAKGMKATELRAQEHDAGFGTSIV